jgi:hypothetical protein
MITLSQSTKLLASVYGLSEATAHTTRKGLIASGMLPAAVGRDIPLATPHRVAILLMGLAIRAPERVGELADLRSFKIIPSDDPDKVKFVDVLGYSIKGLMENPDKGLDMAAVVTTSSQPWAHIQSQGQMLMQFGEPLQSSSPIIDTCAISLEPLAAYCDLAHAVTPPFQASTK